MYQNASRGCHRIGLPIETPRKKTLKVIDFQGLWNVVAVRTGLEPVTPCVTGMYSNQLNYRTKILIGLTHFYSLCFLMKEAVRTGLEPVTPCVTGMYSNQLN